MWLRQPSERDEPEYWPRWYNAGPFVGFRYIDRQSALRFKNGIAAEVFSYVVLPQKVDK